MELGEAMVELRAPHSTGWERWLKMDDGAQVLVRASSASPAPPLPSHDVTVSFRLGGKGGLKHNTEVAHYVDV